MSDDRKLQGAEAAQGNDKTFAWIPFASALSGQREKVGKCLTCDHDEVQ